MPGGRHGPVQIGGRGTKNGEIAKVTAKCAGHHPRVVTRRCDPRMLTQTVADDPRRVARRVGPDQRQDLRHHAALVRDRDRGEPLLSGQRLQPGRDAAIHRGSIRIWQSGDHPGCHQIAQKAINAVDVGLAERPGSAVAVAIVPCELGNRLSAHRLDADSRPYDPRQEMPYGPAMDCHRGRRQPHELEVSTIIIKQLLMLTGIQQPPLPDPP